MYSASASAQTTLLPSMSLVQFLLHFSKEEERLGYFKPAATKQHPRHMTKLAMHKNKSATSFTFAYPFLPGAKFRFMHVTAVC